MSLADDGLSLQERFAPTNRCFGCGQANDAGLRLRSYVGADESTLVAEFMPQPHHGALGSALNGGLISTLFDCHANWSAAHHLMQLGRLDTPPFTVTAELSVNFIKPTPLLGPVALTAKVLGVSGRRVTVDAQLTSANEVRARCVGTLVAVDRARFDDSAH